jgi:Bacterial RNA polymerase, alpha chain C terminal domain/Protein of unknown function (DUF3775)
LPNCLRNDNIFYIGELVQRSEAEMLRKPHFGRKSLNEIKEILAQMGLHLGTELPGWMAPTYEFSSVVRNAKMSLVVENGLRQIRVESQPPAWRGGYRNARRETVHYLLGDPMLGDFLADGLEEFGLDRTD